MYKRQVLWCALNQGGGKFTIVFLKLKIEEKGGGKYGIGFGLGSGHLYPGWIGSGHFGFGFTLGQQEFGSFGFSSVHFGLWVKSDQ